MEVARDYKTLIEALDKMQKESYTVENAWDDFNLILIGNEFHNDCCNLSEYLRNRLPGCSVEAIFNMKNQNISPYVNVSLRKCHPTSVDIEGFFSQLGKLLQKDRNFNTEDIEIYICVLYHSKKL